MKIKQILCFIMILTLCLLPSCGSERKSSGDEETGVATKGDADLTASTLVPDDLDSTGKDNDIDGQGKNNPEIPEYTYEKDLNPDRTILHYKRTNYAEGKQESGYFILGNGDVYFYDFGVVIYNFGYKGEIGMSFEQKLNAIREKTEPAINIGEELVRKICAIGTRIDDKSGYEEKSVMCDYGQKTVYFINPETDVEIMVSSTGDVDKKLKDETAEQFTDFFNNKIVPLLTSASIPENKVYVHAKGEVPMLTLHGVKLLPPGYEMKGRTARFVFDNVKELLALCNRLGVDTFPVHELFDQFSDRYFEYNDIFMEVLVTPTLGYSRDTVGIMMKDNIVSFIPSPTDSDPKECAEDAEDCFVFIAVCGDHNLNADTKGFVDADGNAWERAVVSPEADCDEWTEIRKLDVDDIKELKFRISLSHGSGKTEFIIDEEYYGAFLNMLKKNSIYERDDSWNETDGWYTEASIETADEEYKVGFYGEWLIINGRGYKAIFDACSEMEDFFSAYERADCGYLDWDIMKENYLR